MRAGVVRLDLPVGATVAAPSSGVHLGVGSAGALTLRLFRAGGTHLMLAAPVLPAQLIALRAAGAGVPVQVVTGRPHVWQPLLREGDAHVVSGTEVRSIGAGPSLLIDDRGRREARGAADLAPWQCRLEVRTQWTYDDIAVFGRSDLALLGAVPPDVVASVAAAFRLPLPAAEPLARLDAESFGVVRRGRVEYVSLDPTAAESQVLARARATGPSPAVVPAAYLPGRHEQTVARSQLDAPRMAP